MLGMTTKPVPNVSLGAKSGDGLTPLNRNVGSGPFDPRAEGNTVDVVNEYLAGLDGPAASSERLRVLGLESQQETPRITINGMATFLDDGSDEFAGAPEEEPGYDPEHNDEAEAAGAQDSDETDDGEGPSADKSADQPAEDSTEGETSVDGSTVTES